MRPEIEPFGALIISKKIAEQADSQAISSNFILAWS
jgi:hypothetical protein